MLTWSSLHRIGIQRLDVVLEAINEGDLNLVLLPICEKARETIVDPILESRVVPELVLEGGHNPNHPTPLLNALSPVGENGLASENEDADGDTEMTDADADVKEQAGVGSAATDLDDESAADPDDSDDLDLDDPFALVTEEDKGEEEVEKVEKGEDKGEEDVEEEVREVEEEEDKGEEQGEEVEVGKAMEGEGTTGGESGDETGSESVVGFAKLPSKPKSEPVKVICLDSSDDEEESIWSGIEDEDN